jgi:hypothetical protein
MVPQNFGIAKRASHWPGTGRQARKSDTYLLSFRDLREGTPLGETGYLMARSWIAVARTGYSQEPQGYLTFVGEQFWGRAARAFIDS